MYIRSWAVEKFPVTHCQGQVGSRWVERDWVWWRWERMGAEGGAGLRSGVWVFGGDIKRRGDMYQYSNDRQNKK